MEFFRDKDKGRARKIRVSKLEQVGPGTSEASAASESQQNRGPRRTTPDDTPLSADAPPSSRASAASDSIPKESPELARKRTTLDASDAVTRLYSNGEAF